MSVRENYNKLSKWYDLISGNCEWNLVRNSLNKLDIHSDWIVLDIGFGTGKSLKYLSDRVCFGKVFGIDISEGMIRRTMIRLLKKNHKNNIFIAQGNALNMPFNSRLFDMICINFTLELFKANDINLVLNECKRVLKNSGKLFVIGMLSGYDNRLMVKLYNQLHKLFPHIIDCIPFRISEELERSGFDLISKEERFIWGLPVEIVLANNIFNN